jgi:hypothetical protein
MKKVSRLTLAILGLTAIITNQKPLCAQPIKPAPDGTATVVTPQGNQFNIHVVHYLEMAQIYFIVFNNLA